MKQPRIQSIDALRGLVMIVMALDHIRDFFHYDAFLHNPLDLLYSPADLFLTRWITHFCAPTFIFLTGLSAYLYGLKHTRKELSRFLFIRGLWLIFLEVTIIAFGWFFSFNFHNPTLMVIWAIGISMVFLAIMVRLPYITILITGFAIVFLHNLFDGLHFTEGSIANDVWMVLHVQGEIRISEHFGIYIFYPILPYLGLICVGYGFGKLFAPNVAPKDRKRSLLWIGLSCIVLFIIIRFTNLYGDPHPWSYQIATRYTILSFINCNKYPVSLLFSLMILGPSILFLYFFDRVSPEASAVAQGIQNGLTKVLVTIGKVPMFYYILHLYLIHTIAILTEMPNPNSPMEVTGRFHLWTVYLIWFGVVIVLYLPCKWYGKYKSAHPEKWWLSYL
jgi:uncharacterized membrane protein